MKREALLGMENTGYIHFIRSIAAGGVLGLLGIAGLFLSGCSQVVGHGRGMAVVTDTTGLRDGDLLFRLGQGPESRWVTVASRGVYSHVGIALKADSQWMVIHAVPGENKDRNVPDTLKCESLDDFYLPGRAVSGARGRIDCSDEVAYAAASYALGKVRSHVLFDHHYRMTDTTELYCTELVYWAYLHQGVDLVGHQYSAGFAQGNSEWYIFPSDLWKSSFMVQLQEFSTCEMDGEMSL